MVLREIVARNHDVVIQLELCHIETFEDFAASVHVKVIIKQPIRQEDHSREGFLSGLLLQFINPKIYLYCIMSMEAYILPYYGGQPVILFLFALLLAFIGFAFTLAWAAFGSVFRLLFSRHARVVNTIMALLLVYCAVSLFL